MERLTRVSYEEWKKLIESILYIQRKEINTIVELIEKIDTSEQHPLLKLYTKNLYVEFLIENLRAYINNYVKKCVAEKEKDKYYYFVDEKGFPIMVLKDVYKAYEKQRKNLQII